MQAGMGPDQYIRQRLGHRREGWVGPLMVSRLQAELLPVCFALDGLVIFMDMPEAVALLLR